MKYIRCWIGWVRSRAAWRPRAAKKQRLEESIRRAAAITGPKQSKSAVILAPNGFTSGADTFKNTVLELAGYSNLAVEMGLKGLR